MPGKQNDADKRGYLLENFRLFHPMGLETDTFPYHYHEFHKILVFLSGSLTYLVEGRKYVLRPGDLLLIPAHAIHQPIIDPNTPYDRILLWVQTQPLEALGIDGCFSRTRQENSYLLPRELYDYPRLWGLLRDLERAVRGEAYRDDVLSHALFQQIMVLLCRWRSEAAPELLRQAPAVDAKVEEILEYINGNLTGDLSIDALSARFYLSRSRLMHRFRRVTGCPIYQYVLQKRLILAARLLQQGCGVGEAAARSGFTDYSSFLRSFRRAYHVPPGAYCRAGADKLSEEEIQ